MSQQISRTWRGDKESLEEREIKQAQRKDRREGGKVMSCYDTLRFCRIILLFNFSNK